MNFLTLGELAYLVRSTVQSTLSEEYWVTAEIAQVNCNYSSGHCYLDLVEKTNDTTTAKMRATIWARDYLQIASDFRAVTGQQLQAGMKILMRARVTYHEVHGLSLNIRQIDPSYTLGEMALKRREIIERLTKEGILERNRQLELPPVVQRIAVISSETAAGYGDFLSRLKHNPYGYRFSHRLFPAYMQGERAEESIQDALKKSIAQGGRFDAIVIIRGGGSLIDLHCFDSYAMAKLIALAPLPVFTGIGHERDETVIDRVANRRLITPTAVAEFLIHTAKQFEDFVDALRHRLIIRAKTLTERENHSVDTLVQGLRRFTMHYLDATSGSLKDGIHLLQTRALAALRTPLVDLKGHEGRLKSAGGVMITGGYQRLRDCVKVLDVHPGHVLSMHAQRLASCETRLDLLDPRNVLKRGYSITYLDGKILGEIGLVTKDDIITTRLYDGSITSVVESTGETSENERKEEADLHKSDSGARADY